MLTFKGRAIEMARGDTGVIPVLKKENGIPVTFKKGDLVTFGVKRNVHQEDFDILVQVTMDGSEEIAQIHLSHTDTMIRAGQYLYGIRVRSVEDITVDTVLIEGKFILKHGVTDNDNL